MIFLSFELAAVGFEKLTYTTEDYPPLNYLERGEVKGLAVDLLRLVWEELDVPEQDIYVMPWARAYYNLQHKKDLVLFATSKTEERTPLFKWACPIIRVNYVLYALKNKNILINNAKELSQYQIGTIRFDAAEQILMNEFDVKLNMVSNVSLSANLQMLKKDRIQLFAFYTAGAKQLFRANGYNPNDLSIVYPLKEVEDCFAFSRNVDQKLVNQFRQALNDIVVSDEYVKLLRKYRL